jgi:hypothetical protein
VSAGLHGIELLRGLALGQLTEAERLAVAERVRCYLAQAHTGLSLEEAFGLSVGPGGEPWYTRDRRVRRDGELRALVRRFGAPDRSLRDRALWLQHLVRRYEANAWPRDRSASEMPEHYLGTEREYLYRAFAACTVPTSEKQLWNILKGDAEFAS